MNIKNFSFILFILTIYFNFAWILSNEFQSEFVKDIHDGELDKFITQNEFVLVMFYAPWCGHCKRLLPEYIEAATILSEKKSNIKLAKVDATTENSLAQEFGITGYPTLILFDKKKRVNYNGGRTAKSIVQWLSQMTGPIFTDLNVEHLNENIEDILKKEKINVAFFLEYTSKNSDIFIKFNEVGEKFREMAKFFIIKADHEKLTCFRENEDKVEFNKEDTVEHFISTEVFPLFGVISTENYRFYAESSKELVWICATNTQYDELKKEVRLAATHLRDQTHFVLLSIPEYADHAKASLGINNFPGLAFQTAEGRFLLPNPKEALKDHKLIIQFFKDVEEGKIKKSLKSEPIPEDDKNANVKVVVGDSFIDVVLNSGKDVLLEIYAPWCGHCKKLQPIYEELGRHLKKYDSIIIAKMDGTLNETPLKHFEWSGFPTIFFVKAGSQVPLPYEGERSLKGFLDFLNKHATKAPFVLDAVEEKTDEL